MQWSENLQHFLNSRLAWRERGNKYVLSSGIMLPSFKNMFLMFARVSVSACLLLIITHTRAAVLLSGLAGILFFNTLFKLFTVLVLKSNTADTTRYVSISVRYFYLTMKNIKIGEGSWFDDFFMYRIQILQVYPFDSFSVRNSMYFLTYQQWIRIKHNWRMMFQENDECEGDVMSWISQ